MSVKEGRILSQHEEVDHLDGDKLNDSIDNLEIVTREENVRRRNKLSKITTVNLKFPFCKEYFERGRRQTHLVKGGDKTFCSRSCASKYQHLP